MHDGFAEWGAVLSQEMYTNHDMKNMQAIMNNPEQFFEYAHNYTTALHTTKWRVSLTTQSASDAANTLLGDVGEGGRLYVEDGAFHAARGLLGLYGPFQNDRTRRATDLIECYELPRRGASDMRDILTSLTPLEGDEEALAHLNRAVRANSIVIVQTISNSVWNGCASGYFLIELGRLLRARQSRLIVDETLTAVRTGSLWSFEHVPGFVPDGVIFGKGIGISGIAVPQNKPMKTEHVTLPVHPCALYMTKKRMRAIHVWLRASAARAKQFLRARMFVENEFENIQGIGLLYATIDQNIIAEEYKMGQARNCSFSQLDNVMRFTFTIDAFIDACT